jgi:CBS domain containing-hemolysin-like protein
VTGWYLLITLGLLVANGFFVAAEFALTAARWTRLEELADGGNSRARVALSSIRELSFMLAGAQLGITMASLGLGYVAEPAVARLIEAALHTVVEIPEGALHSISLAIALAIVVFLHMVIGEMAPKNIAISEAETTALWLAVPFRLYANVFRPFIAVLNALANRSLRLFEVEPQNEIFSKHTAEEIGSMVEESAKQGMMREFEHRLLSGAVALGERDAASVMVPRTEMTAVPVTSTPEDIERVVLETGHSRIPLYTRDVDDIAGFFHAKDLLRIPDDRRAEPISRKYIRQMLVVPESRKLRPLLVDMRRRRQHLALVVDEHGGTSGVVTLEDLLEELVGEIRDETDVAELGIDRVGQGHFVVPGSLHIADVADYLGLVLPEGEYETIAGFLMDRLGRIPKRRDVVEHKGWKLRVRQMQRRRVVQVIVEEPPRTVLSETSEKKAQQARRSV